MLSIELTDDRWIKTPHGHILGSAFVDDRLLDAPAIDAFLYDSLENQLTDRLLKLNGRWSVCLTLASGMLLVATDRTRTWPIFYTTGPAGIFLSDKAENVRTAAGDTKPDPVACEEFLHTCCVTGRDTLFPHVKQMLGGEMLLVTENNSQPTLNIVRWYTFRPQEPAAPRDLEEYLEQLDALMLKAHQRLIDYANGRPIYIPLSGGVDSRSVATTLVRLKYDNLHAYCYGDPAASDPIVSREVAKKLNIPWQHIPYSKKMWREEFQKPYFQEYLRRYFQYTSVPNIQELPAARILKESRSIQDDAVVVPGECDLYMGSNALPYYTTINNKKDLYKILIQKGYSFSATPLSKSTKWDKRINDILGNPSNKLSSAEVNSYFEQWLTQEITNKFYIYTMSAHVFFHTELYYPLCDNTLLNFWEAVPHRLRFNRTLQLAYVQKQYALACGADPSISLVTDRNRAVPQTPKILLKKWRFLIPPIFKYTKRHLLLYKNKWAYHYAFPFSFRHQCVKEGNLAVHYMYAKYLLENFI
jgi:asparagine synthase (glutamine-hydrolysing)